MNYTAHVDLFVRENLPAPDLLPEFIFETPELQFPEHLNAAVALLDKAVAEGSGERVAVIGKGVLWTYRDLQHNVNRLARLLTEDMGLVPGNRVLLRGANTPWFAAGWLAVWKAGGVVVGTMPLLRAKELKQFIRLARITHALCEASLMEELEAARSECPELTQVLSFADSAFAAKLAGKSADFTAVDTSAEENPPP